MEVQVRCGVETTGDITCRGCSPRLDFTSNDYGKHKGTPESIFMLMSTKFHILPCNKLRGGATESRGYLYIEHSAASRNRAR